MRKPVRLLVFDLDGTLVDSRRDLAASVNHALRAIGLTSLPDETISSYIGNGARALVERSVGPDRAELVPEVLASFLAHYRQHLLDTTVPYPGVSEGLAGRGAGFEKAVLTNKPIEMTRAILSGLSLAHFFVDVRGGDSFGTKKPDPEGLRAVMRRRSALPGETLMVGDSANDILAGQRAGAATCGVTYGLGAGDFAGHPPDFTIERFPELFERIRPVR